MTPLRVAFIGIDNPHGCAWRQAVAVHPEMEPVALVARSPEETQTLQPELKDLPLYYSLDELLAGVEFDAAAVTLSNKEAPGVCVSLANAGKHLLAEKTTARNGDEFQTVADAVEASGVQFTTGYTWRFSPTARDIRRMIQEGRLGQVWSFCGRMFTSTVKSRNPQHFLFSRDASGGGMFNWLGCHALDLMLYFVDQPVASVTAKVGNITGEDIDVEDGGVAIFQFADGAIGSLQTGYFLPGGNQIDYGIHGSKGWARWCPLERVLHFHSQADDMKAAPERSIAYELPEVDGYAGQMGQDLLTDWLVAIRENGTTLNNTRTAMAVHRLLDAIYRSSEDRREVLL